MDLRWYLETTDIDAYCVFPQRAEKPLHHVLCAGRGCNVSRAKADHYATNAVDIRFEHGGTVYASVRDKGVALGFEFGRHRA